MRVLLGGNHALYVVGVLGQIGFSGALFVFWLSYADGMNAQPDGAPRSFCCFYLPKLALAALYVGASAVLFIGYGRVPDRINLSDARVLPGGQAQLGLLVALCGSVVGVGLWLSCLVSRALYRLGWKKVEYIYTEREKSFVGITIVFVVLSLVGQLYRAVHGRRGSWMQLQLPFLTLTNSYLALLTHAFWPGASGAAVGAAEGAREGDATDGYEGYGQVGRGGKRLLADDDDD